MTNEEIIAQLKLENTSEESQAHIVESLRTIVELRVITIITELMSEEQAHEFTKLQEANDSQAIWDWLRTEVAGVDVSEIYEATLRDYLAQHEQDQQVFLDSLAR